MRLSLGMVTTIAPLALSTMSCAPIHGTWVPRWPFFQAIRKPSTNQQSKKYCQGHPALLLSALQGNKRVVHKARLRKRFVVRRGLVLYVADCEALRGPHHACCDAAPHYGPRDDPE